MKALVYTLILSALLGSAAQAQPVTVNADDVVLTPRSSDRKNAITNWFGRCNPQDISECGGALDRDAIRKAAAEGRLVFAYSDRYVRYGTARSEAAPLLATLAPVAVSPAETSAPIESDAAAVSVKDVLVIRARGNLGPFQACNLSTIAGCGGGADRAAIRQAAAEGRLVFKFADGRQVLYTP